MYISKEGKASQANQGVTPFLEALLKGILILRLLAATSADQDLTVHQFNLFMVCTAGTYMYFQIFAKSND
jgi:hypothetical protein